MFVRFKGFRDKLRQRGPHVDHELTLQNSNLNANQIATALKALKILGLEPRQQALTKQDFIIFLYAMGLNPTEDIIDSKLRAFKLHHKKHFTFGQLAHVWYSMLQDLTDEDEILKRAFQFFDKDGNGDISVEELKTTMHELGDLLTEEEIAAFMAIMDVNNDGVIGYEEFLDTLKTQAPPLQGEGGARLQQQRLQQQQHKVDCDKSVLARLGGQHYDQQSEHLPEHIPDHAGLASHAPTSTRDNLAAAAAAALLHHQQQQGDGQPQPPAPPTAAQRTGSTRAGASRLSHDSAAGAAGSLPLASASLGPADGHRRGGSLDGPEPRPCSPLRQGSLRAGPVPLHTGTEEVQRPPSRPGEQPPSHEHQQQQGGEASQPDGKHGGGVGALPGRSADGERPSPGWAGRQLPPLGSSPGERQGLPQPRKTDSYIADLGPGDPAGAAGAAAGGGLRAPCVLEPGPGSDGSGSPAGPTGMTPPGSRPASARRGP